MTEAQRTLLNNIEMYYKRMCNCCSTAGKKANFEKLIEYYSQDVAFCSIYWEDCRKSNYGAMPYLERIKKRIVPLVLEEETNFQERPATKIPCGKRCGLYFVGQCAFNPYTREERYCLKVGMSTDLNSRMKSYATHSPMCWLIDYREFAPESLKNKETLYHNALKEIAKKVFETEWVEVDRNTYLLASQKGFDFFKNSVDF